MTAPTPHAEYEAPRWRCPNCGELVFDDQMEMLEHAIQCDGGGDYGATATLLYNAPFGGLIGRALLFAHQNMPNLSMDEDRILGALARTFLDTAKELEG